MFYIFFLYLVFEVQCAFSTKGTSQIGLAALVVLGNHMGLVAPEARATR